MLMSQKKNQTKFKPEPELLNTLAEKLRTFGFEEPGMAEKIDKLGVFEFFRVVIPPKDKIFERGEDPNIYVNEGSSFLLILMTEEEYKKRLFYSGEHQSDEIAKSIPQIKKDGYLTGEFESFDVLKTQLTHTLKKDKVTRQPNNGVPYRVQLNNQEFLLIIDRNDYDTDFEEV